IQDEMRMFVQAISRASESVLITAINDEENGPSLFLNRLVDAVPNNPLRDEHPKIIAEHELEHFSLRKLVGTLRRQLTREKYEHEMLHGAGIDYAPGQEPGQKPGQEPGHEPSHDSPSGVSSSSLSEASEQALAALRVLSEHGVSGAHPDGWYGLQEISSVEPLVDLENPETSVHVSPSQLNQFLKNELPWVISKLGGDTLSNHLALGNIFHKILEEEDDISFAALWQGIEAQWGQLSFEAEWLSEKEKKRIYPMVRRLAHYLNEFSESGAKVVAKETPFRLPIARAVLSGTVDRIEQDAEGKIWVVDLKTGNSTPTTDAKIADDLQLRAYQYAITQGALDDLVQGELGGAKFIVLASHKAYAKNDDIPAQPEQPPISAETGAEFALIVSEAAIRMAGAAFEGKIDNAAIAETSFKIARIHIIGAVSD
ncbi:MAG: PD-(D/E)XK nuclease family protein, partial [Microbacteriaceae bacterium]